MKKIEVECTTSWCLRELPKPFLQKLHETPASSGTYIWCSLCSCWQHMSQQSLTYLTFSLQKRLRRTCGDLRCLHVARSEEAEFGRSLHRQPMAIVLYRHKTLFLIDGDLHRVRIVLNWDSMWPTDSVDLNKINKWITKLYQEHSTNIYIYMCVQTRCMSM